MCTPSFYHKLVLAGQKIIIGAELETQNLVLHNVRLAFIGI